MYVSKKDILFLNILLLYSSLKNSFLGFIFPYSFCNISLFALYRKVPFKCSCSLAAQNLVLVSHLFSNSYSFGVLLWSHGFKKHLCMQLLNFYFQFSPNSKCVYPTLYSTISWRVSKRSTFICSKSLLFYTHTCSFHKFLHLNCYSIPPTVQTKDICYIMILLFLSIQSNHKDNFLSAPLKYKVFDPFLLTPLLLNWSKSPQFFFFWLNEYVK